MASNRSFRFGPVALANTVGNILYPPTAASGGVNSLTGAGYIILRHIRIVNKTAGAVTFSLNICASGLSTAGTEFMGTATSVAANSYVDWYGALRLDGSVVTDFLTGFASAATSLTIQGEGEIGYAG